ncbi:MAG: hypothetical protein L0207_03760 [Chlamydiae bacterium]|nr:hypothetical protein [Chlamydiota bacterium]
MILINLLLLTSSIEPAHLSTVSSTDAHYDGDILVLNGNVELCHEFGKITAEFAELEKQKAEESPSFSFATLKNHVQLFLKNRGELSCDHAKFDFTALQGKFFPENGKKILYRDSIPLNEKKQINVKIQSQLAEVDFAKNDSKLSLSEVRALEDVLIESDGGTSLSADSASYSYSFSLNRPIVTAKGKDDASYCHLTHLCDSIYAKKINWDLLSSKFFLHNVNGQLVSTIIPSLEQAAFSFQSDEMFWDQPSQKFELIGEVEIEEPTLGLIQCEKAQIECQTNGENKLYPKLITLEGMVRITSLDPNQSPRCSISKRATYSPETETLILSGEKKNKVLLWDALEGLTLSATEISIQKEESASKGQIKGAGNVRFAFNSIEHEFFKKIFPFYQPPSKNE